MRWSGEWGASICNLLVPGLFTSSHKVQLSDRQGGGMRRKCEPPRNGRIFANYNGIGNWIISYIGLICLKYWLFADSNMYLGKELWGEKKLGFVWSTEQYKYIWINLFKCSSRQ